MIFDAEGGFWASMAVWRICFPLFCESTPISGGNSFSLSLCVLGLFAEHGLDYIKSAREIEESDREWERKKATGDLTDYERELLEEERQLLAEAEAYDRENPR